MDSLELKPWGAWTGRAILLVDLDAFFALVEQLDHPAWRGKPVIVGGNSKKRGVVSTASYEARAFGVHSAMPSVMAERLCPDAFWTSGHYERYQEISRKVMDIIASETPYFEQVSIDEAFVDVSPTKINREHPVSIAERIQNRVAELGITCSIGLASSKAIAKLASDMDKPRGLTVVLPGSELNFMDKLPVRRLSGVGSSVERRLYNRGIETLGDLYKCDPAELERALGKVGRVLYERVHGTDIAPLVSNRPEKSISKEMSFAKDLKTRDEITAAIDVVLEKVARRLRKKDLVASTYALKVRYANRALRSCQFHLDKPSNEVFVLRPYLYDMLDRLWTQGMALRLVGVSASGLEKAAPSAQLELFDEEEQLREQATHNDLTAATDNVKERFGDAAIHYGYEFKLSEKLTDQQAQNIPE